MEDRIMEKTLPPIDVTPDARLLEIIATYGAAGKAYNKWHNEQVGSVLYEENADDFIRLEMLLDDAMGRFLDLLNLKLLYRIDEQCQ